MGLELLYANINGAKLPYIRNKKGERFSPEANKLKDEGMLPGVPDLFLPKARGGFHGLYIELKVGDNKPSMDQLRFIASVREEGFRVDVCWGAGQAVKAVKEYLGAEAVTWPDL
jgi:hypothetical protein